MDVNFVAFREEIERELQSIKVPAHPANLYDPVRYIMGLGGKRIRPVLTLMGCALMGGNPKNAMNQALAVEIFHNFTLLHDDIMDRADVRRGLPTVHKKWNDNIAILSGDGMLVIAYQYLMRAPADKLSALSQVFSNVALEVCEGQQLDMDYAHKEDVGLEAYISMIRLKTAVLLGGSMQLGAIIAGADRRALDGLAHFAENLGLAFQIMDDYLDSFGSAASFGKEIGGDIREGKRTWLTIKAFELASQDQQQRLRAAYKSEDLDFRLSEVMDVYAELKIADHVKAEIDRYSTISADSLDQIGGDEAVKQQLRELVNYLMGREV